VSRPAALAVLALAAACGSPAQAEAADPAAPLSVRGTFTPAAIRFADPVVAEVEVAYDPSRVDGKSIRVAPNFGPLVATASPAVAHARRGAVAVLRLRYPLQCLTAGCLATAGALSLRLPRLTVTGHAHGRRVEGAAAWPALRIVSRLSRRAAAGPVSFRHQRVLPAPAYALSPSGAAAGLLAASVLAAGAGIALLVRELRRRSARPRAQPLSALERALRYARDAAARPDPADRRRALDFLAEAVEGAGDDRLAHRVREAAWVETPPTPRRSVELADAAEGAGERQ
jgi:hypothetical protein